MGKSRLSSQEKPYVSCSRCAVPRQQKQKETDGLSLCLQTSKTLVDMVPLKVDPKKVAPLSEQDELETRRVWDDVCQSILRKEFNEASKKKQTLEQAQRDKAEARKKSGEPCVCTFTSVTLPVHASYHRSSTATCQDTSSPRATSGTVDRSSVQRVWPIWRSSSRRSTSCKKEDLEQVF